jgi:hypothetical protein
MLGEVPAMPPQTIGLFVTAVTVSSINDAHGLRVSYAMLCSIQSRG